MTRDTNLAELLRLARRGRRSEQRGKAITEGVSLVLVAVIGAALHGLYLMWLLEILHDQWPQVPAWGFWRSVAVAVLVTGLFTRAKSAKAGDKS